MVFYPQRAHNLKKSKDIAGPAFAKPLSQVRLAQHARALCGGLEQWPGLPAEPWKSTPILPCKFNFIFWAVFPGTNLEPSAENISVSHIISTYLRGWSSTGHPCHRLGKSGKCWFRIGAIRIAFILTDFMILLCHHTASFYGQQQWRQCLCPHSKKVLMKQPWNPGELLLVAGGIADAVGSMIWHTFKSSEYIQQFQCLFHSFF